MLKEKIKLCYLVLVFSIVNIILYNIPFFNFVVSSIDIKSFNGILLFISLIILAIVLNAFVFFLLLFLLRKIGKWLIALLFVLNSVALYFVNTYNALIDRTMIDNVFNTNFEESSSFLSVSMILYLVFLGIIPAFFVLKTSYIQIKLKTFLISFLLTLVFLLSLIYANATNWLWIDNNSKTLGSLVMPWSYVVNTCRYYQKKNKENKQQILLPNATIKNNEKSIVVLVIGESARSQNFSLYGYDKKTNPLLTEISNIHTYKTESCATYTTAGVKCILEHKNSNELYETLPNYLDRNGVDVIWRTTNSGEPKVKIKNYQSKKDLEKKCNNSNCEYDEVLLNGLKEQIASCKKNKILIVLHTSTSHGPTYYKKYPSKFSQFKPECKNVEVAQCTQDELINSYDNTILYTDYLLATIIYELKQLKEFKSSMMYISDHGESLGENNLYMHGLPVSIAPKEQFDIPFIVWASEKSKEFKNTKKAEQHNVFHTVLDFLDIESPIYDKNMSLYEKK